MFDFLKRQDKTGKSVEVVEVFEKEEIDKVEANIRVFLNYSVEKANIAPKNLEENRFYSKFNYTAKVKIMDYDFMVWGKFNEDTPSKKGVTFKYEKRQEKLAYIHLLWLISTEEGNETLVENLKIRLYSDIITHYEDKKLNEIIKLIEKGKELKLNFNLEIPKNKIDHSS